MKKILCLAMGLCLLLLFGCAESKSEWKKEDFSFYDDSNEEVDFPTDNYIYLTDLNEERSGEFQTSKGVKIGQRATSALEKYDLGKFYWGIMRWRSPTEDEEKLEQKLHEKYESISDAIAHSSEFLSGEAELYLTGKFYVTDEEKLIQCELDDNGNPVGEESLGREMYSISFRVKDEKISEVDVQNRKENPLLVVREKDGISNVLPHTTQLEFGVTKDALEKKVGALVDLTEEIGFTGGTDQKEVAQINGHDFYVSYYFNEENKLSGVRYIGESSSEAYTAIKQAITNILGDPCTLDVYKEGKDMPAWSVSSGGYTYTSDAHTDDSQNKIVAFYRRNPIVGN